MSFSTVTIDQAFKSIESDAKDVVMRYDCFNDAPYMTDDGKEIYDEFTQNVWDKALEIIQEGEEEPWPSSFTITQDQGFFGSREEILEFFNPDLEGSDAEEVMEYVNERFVEELDRAVEVLAAGFHADLAYKAMQNAGIECSYSGTEEVSVPTAQHFDEENNLHPEGEFAIEYLAENIHSYNEIHELEGRCLFSFEASL